MRRSGRGRCDAELMAGVGSSGGGGSGVGDAGGGAGDDERFSTGGTDGSSAMGLLLLQLSIKYRNCNFFSVSDPSVT